MLLQRTNYLSNYTNKTMKVELTDTGRYILVAETAEDNTLLFSLTNTPNLNGVHFNFPNAVQAEKKGFSIRNFFGRTEINIPDTQSYEVEIPASEKSPEPKAEPEPKAQKKETKRAYKKSGKPRLRTCTVCGKKTHMLALHLRKAHGIMADGSVQLEQKFSTRYTPGEHQVRMVKQPVVKLPDGTYRLLPKKGLLDSHEE
jgi:hypothetical protein